MEHKEYLIKLDVYHGLLESKVMSFNQLNTGTCRFIFELTSNKEAFNLTDTKVTLTTHTPSGATVEDNILVTDATTGKAEYTLANDMLAEAGCHYGEISVYSLDNTKLLTTSKFRYIVDNQLGEANVKVDTRYATLQECLIQTKAVQDSVLGNAEIIRVSKENATQGASNSIQSSLASQESAKSAQQASETVDQVVELARQSAEASKQSANASKSSADEASRAKDVALQASTTANQASRTANMASANAEKALQDTLTALDKVHQAETSAQNSAQSASAAESSANNSKTILEEKIAEVDIVKANVDATVSTANTANDTATTNLQKVETLTATNNELIQKAATTTAKADQAIQQATTTKQAVDQALVDATTQVNLAKAEVAKAESEAVKATQQAIKATEQAGIAQSHAETAQGELSKVTAEGVKQIKAVSDKGVEQVQAVATEGAKQIELAKTEVIKAEAAATLATTEADRAGAQAQEKVNNKIGINGVHDDTIFNFISSENKINSVNVGGTVYTFQGEKGDKGEPGTASVAINDNVTNAQQTWSSERINEKLEETHTKLIKNNESVSHEYYNKALVSFMWDDGYSYDYDIIKPVFVEENVPNNICPYTAWISETDTTGAISKRQIKELYDLGWGIENHTHTHCKCGEKTEDELEYEFITSKKIIKEIVGEEPSVLVWPYGSTSELARKVARKHFKGAINIGGDLNILPLDQFSISRKDGFGETSDISLDTAKSYVDSAVSSGTWLIFKMHSGYDNWKINYETYLPRLRALIQYIKSLNVEIVTVKKALELKGNIIDTGDSENKYCRVGKDGSLKSTDIKTDYYIEYKNKTISSSTKISEYPIGVSIVTLMSDDATGKGWPEHAGTVETHRLYSKSTGETMSYQLFMPYATNKIYRRYWLEKWNDTSTWSEFQRIDSVNCPIKVSKTYKISVNVLANSCSRCVIEDTIVNDVRDGVIVSPADIPQGIILSPWVRWDKKIILDLHNTTINDYAKTDLTIYITVIRY